MNSILSLSLYLSTQLNYNYNSHFGSFKFLTSSLERERERERERDYTIMSRKSPRRRKSVSRLTYDALGDASSKKINLKKTTRRNDDVRRELSVVAGGWMHPVLRSWLLGMRPWSLPISIVPIVLAGVIVFMDPYPSLDRCETTSTLYRWEFVACLIGGMSIHAGANLLNTYHDFKSGVDTKHAADDRTLVDGTMRPNEVRYLGLFLFALATSLALWLASKVGSDLLILYAAGTFLAFFYTADPLSLKYIGLGDVTVFLCFGPLLMTGVSTALGCGTNWTVLVLSIPCGLLTEAVLHANNVRDVEADRRVGVRTVAQFLSNSWNGMMYTSCFGLSYIIIISLVLMYVRFTLFSLTLFRHARTHTHTHLHTGTQKRAHRTDHSVLWQLYLGQHF